VLALAMTLVLQVVLPYQDPASQASPVAVRRPKLIVVPTPPEYAAILQAPIFSPDRKPGEDADAAPGASALDAYAALGVAMGPGFATAVVKTPEGKIVSIKPGETLEGWRLAVMDRTKLGFQRGDARHVLTIGTAPTPTPGQQTRTGDDQ
jgi:hypothetical protein